MSKFRKTPIFKPLVWLMIVLVLAACNYYKTRPFSPQYAANINDIGRLYQHFFIHEAEGKIWYLTGIELDSLNLTGEIIPPPVEVPIFLPGMTKKPFRYEVADKNDIRQVHFYLTESGNLTEGSVKIPLDQFDGIKITTKDGTKNAIAHTGVALGTIVGILVVFTIIALLTKSSCPYVYAGDGEGLVFQGEMYGGAILHNLERDDYLPLPDIRPIDDSYHIRIANELKERQYTNMAHLITVDHSPQVQVLLDQRGKAYSLEAPAVSVEACNSLGIDLREPLLNADEYFYNFEDPESSTQGLILEFDKPAEAQHARLLLNARNSLWLEYLFGRFSQKFGSFHDVWIERQKEQSPYERQQQTVAQDFALSIFVERDGQWEFLERIPTIGPLASRDMLVPVSLVGISSETVRIKITTGFMFWDLDRVAMDFSEQSNLKVHRLFPQHALTNENQDIVEVLLATDDQYMEQPNVGDQTEIRYAVPPLASEMKRSVFLHSAGYYEHIREYEGLPQLEALLPFRNAGHFHQFSQSEYDQFLNRKPALAVRP